MQDNFMQSGSLQILLLLAFLIPAVLFLLTQQNTLKTIKVENRLMAPGLVWLQLIPLFGQIWQFFVVTRIAISIRKEMASQRDDSILGFPNASAVEKLGKRPTFAIGITYCVLYIIGSLLLSSPLDPTSSVEILPPLFLLAGITCWIVYWVQLVRCKLNLSAL